MDERLISQSLQDKARKDIPDDMNLIPEVIEKVGRVSRSAARSRLSWVATAVLGMLAVSVVAYAATLLLQGDISDPGLRGANEADLITVLNMTQTIDGVTVTLDYAYADSNRISIGYHASGEAPIGTGYEFTSERLTDSAGHEFQSMFGGGGGGGGSSSGNPTVSTFSQEKHGSYDVTMLDDSPAELDMRLEIGIDKVVGATLSDGGTPQPVEGDPIREPLGPFVFEFTIPLIQGQVVEPQQSANANGSTLTLERLVIAPSFTRGRVCFEQPPTESYAPVVSLTIDGEAVELSTPQSLAPAAEDSSDGCYDLRINQSLYDLPGEWRLSIDRLILYLPVGTSSGSNGTTFDYTVDSQVPELLAQVRAELEPLLAPHGIEISESQGHLAFSFDVNAEVNEADIARIMTDTITDEISGPWVFTFEVPPIP